MWSKQHNGKVSIIPTTFAHVESRLSGRKQQKEVVFYTPVNLCDRREGSASVAVGLYTFLPSRRDNKEKT